MPRDPVSIREREMWEKLNEALLEKLQLGLVDHLRRAVSYRFEGNTLFLEPGSPDDRAYFERGHTMQQLQVLLEDAVGISQVTLI